MVILNTRSRDILLILLRSEEPLGSKEIAKQLMITPRMVRYNIDAIERWLKAHGGYLISKPNYGIFVQVEPHLKQNLIHEIENLSGYPLKLSSDERWRILILYFLLQDNAVPAEKILDQLHISRTTLFKDLKKTERWFEAHRMGITRKPGGGFKVSGQENFLRVAIEDFLMENVGELTLFELCSGSQTALQSRLKGRIGLYHLLNNFFDELDLCTSEGLIRNCESSIGVQYTDSAYLSLVLHLAILIWGSQKKRSITFEDQVVDEVTTYPEFKFAEKISTQLAKEMEISLNKSEIVYLTMHLLGAQTRWTVANIVESKGSQQIDSEITQLVDAILSTASIYLHPVLKTDTQLALALAFHLKPFVFKLKYDLPVRNPLLGETIKMFPYAYKVAQKCTEIIEEKVSKPVPDAEVGKIAMHFAAAMVRMRATTTERKKVVVVCGEGISTAWLVVSKLQVEVPEIEVIEIMSKLEISRKTSFSGEFDGFISTVPLNLPGIPIAVISPLLTDEDKVHIRNVFQTSSSMPVYIEAEALLSGPPLNEILSLDTIELNLRVKTWQDAVEAGGKLLVETRAVEYEYIQAVVELIERHGPYMVILPGVVLLHAKPERGTNHLGMSLVTLKTPVEFGHPQNDPVRIVITLSATGGQIHLRALMEIVELLQKQENRKTIINAKKPQKIIELINNVGEKNSKL